MNLSAIRTAFDTLNHEYLALHRAKEDKFWGTNMGTDPDDDGFVAAEKAWTAFLTDPVRSKLVSDLRGALGAAEGDEDERAALDRGLAGWQAFFEAHSLGSPRSRTAWDEVLAREADLFAQRRSFQPTHLSPSGTVEKASLGVLRVAMATNPNEAGRRSSFEAFRSLETWVLDHGFAAIIRARNAFARLQGFDNYFEYKVRKTEKMSADELFVILDEFEALTRDAQARCLEELRRRGGEAALAPWNQKFFSSGVTSAELDPFFPFSRAVTVWVESFRRLGISFRGARLTLDLLDRQGKQENGFCHGPVPAFFDGDRWVPAVVNFTSNAEPAQVGSGLDALQVLFHEGGHAAHFSNITGNAPCFSQEFAPTSMAYAETQSMFLDSVVKDADWLVRYAGTPGGRTLPPDLIRRRIEATQPFAVQGARGLLVVPVFERALYRLADDELTNERILTLARDTEKLIFGTEGTRPLLAVPHLLNQESAASYQGYLLAEMAVAQTRAWFLERFGYIADNPEVGPLLARHYWNPGNAATLDACLKSLTGQGFSGRPLAAECAKTAAEAWSTAQASMEAARTRAYGDPNRGLDADVRIVDGLSTVAENQLGDEALGRAFEAWLGVRRG